MCVRERAIEGEWEREGERERERERERGTGVEGGGGLGECQRGHACTPTEAMLLTGSYHLSA